MLVKHSKVKELENFVNAYVVELPSGDRQLVEIGPWLSEMGWHRDYDIKHLKSAVELQFGEAELQYDSELDLEKA